MNNTIENLKKYNLWRRGDESIEQPDPKDIGIWIDEICEIAEKLERERDEVRAELSLKCQSVTIASGTISDLLKKSERLEKQIEGLNNFANERFDEIQRVRRERDEAMRELENMKETKRELMQMVYGRNWVEQSLRKERDEARRERKIAREDAEFWHKLYKQFSIY